MFKLSKNVLSALWTGLSAFGWYTVLGITFSVLFAPRLFGFVLLAGSTITAICLIGMVFGALWGVFTWFMGRQKSEDYIEGECKTV